MMELPKITPDPMMDELHEVRRQLHEQLKGLSAEERVAWYQQQMLEEAEEAGCDIVPSEGHPHAYRLVPRSTTT
jgi:hypothetical protein